MNTRLEELALRIGLERPASFALALAFGLACARRVEHLLEEPAVVACLDELARSVDGRSSRDRLDEAARRASALATSHRGSASIDGCGHAAVSATYGAAQALVGKPLQAASYCAYATVYASGGSAAVADRDAFEPEFRWQVECLERLAAEVQAAPAG